MQILVTGALGGIGTEVLRRGHEKGHRMSAFELDNKANRDKAIRLQEVIENIYWGDLRNQNDVNNALLNQDVIIHLGAIVPPFSEQNPKLADAVNIGGTRNIIRAIEQSGSPTGLVFTSSMSIMGADKDRQPPLRVGDPLIASSNYTRQKIECERLLAKTGIPWVITRLGAVVNTSLSIGGGSINQILDEIFSMSLDNRIEGVWNVDVATALISGAEQLITGADVVNRKTFFLGGGRQQGWQMTVQEFYQDIFEAIGFGLPDESCFNTQPYYADWLDTEEGQQLFQYQNHSFEEFLSATRKKLGLKRILIKLIAPIIRKVMSQKSKYR